MGSQAYECSKHFREALLRKPLGIELTSGDTQGEDSQIHTGILDTHDQIKGIVILKPLSNVLMKLRQMAIDKALQGTGWGRKLVRHAEELASARGFAAVETHARMTARGFYEKMGYHAVGEPFTEVTIAAIKC